MGRAAHGYHEAEAHHWVYYDRRRQVHASTPRRIPRRNSCGRGWRDSRKPRTHCHDAEYKAIDTHRRSQTASTQGKQLRAHRRKRGWV